MFRLMQAKYYKNPTESGSLPPEVSIMLVVHIQPATKHKALNTLEDQPQKWSIDSLGADRPIASDVESNLRVWNGVSTTYTFTD